LQPLKTIDVRQPVNTPASANAAAATSPATNEPATAESLGWQLRAALPPLRLHSVSLYDDEANVLWLSEGALGPDEHNLVVEAIDALGSDGTLNVYETGLEDGRVSIFLPVRAPQGSLVGLAMILADIKSVGEGVLERMLSPQVRAIMQKVAVLLRPAPSAARAATPEVALQILELAPEAESAPAPVAAQKANGRPAAPAISAAALSIAPTPGRNTPALTPAPPTAAAAAAAKRPAAPLGKPIAPPTVSAPPAAAAPAKGAAVPALSPEAIDDILEFELTPEPPVVQTQKLPALVPTNFVDLSLEATADRPAAKAPAAPAKGAAAAPVAKPPVAAPAVVAPRTAAAAAFTTNVSPFPSPTTAPVAAATPAATINFNAADEDEFAIPASLTAAAARNAPSLPAAAPIVSAPAAAAPVLTAAPTVAPAIPVVAAPPPLAAPPTLGAASPAQRAPAASQSQPAAPTNISAAAASKVASTSATTTSAKVLAVTGTTKALGTAATSTSRILSMPDGLNLILEVQPFTKLRTGGRTRRYEVLARSSHPTRVPAGMDNIALQRLLTWLGANRAAWTAEPTSFTLNLSIATLEDERFPQFVSSNLKAHGIAADNIGFEIAEPLCVQRRAQVERFITLCDRLGCFVVIDDFSFDSSIVGLLRSKALRMVKIDPKLTSVALKDKLAQAIVVAIAQAVKVLGIHCAAKRVESQAALQWLTAIGCDFAQGPALAQLQPLETLCSLPPPLEPPK
jgi:EAL domain-containing protein (putative c-di-GMP-specific phosphodiesterase class I)